FASGSPNTTGTSRAPLRRSGSNAPTCTKNCAPSASIAERAQEEETMNSKAMLVLVIAAACGKKDGGGGGGATAAKIDVAGVNALVPAALKDKLVFEQREVKEDSGKHSPTFTLAAPKGWEQKMKMMATLRPPDSANLGFMTEFHLSSNCDGDCAAK